MINNSTIDLIEIERVKTIITTLNKNENYDYILAYQIIPIDIKGSQTYLAK